MKITTEENNWKYNGKWKYDVGSASTRSICTVCNTKYHNMNKGAYQMYMSNYCPNCGEKMLESVSK